MNDPTKTPLFISGESDYPRYRIPSLVCTPKGTLLAFTSGWKGYPGDRNRLDSTGEVDLLLRRSLDGGHSWEPVRVVMAEERVSWCNYCPVVERTSGKLLLTLCKNNRQAYVMKSEDEGVTWSGPEEITDQVYDPAWTHVGIGPGQGIQMKNGRIVLPAWSDYENWKHQQSFVVFSTDGGKSWARGPELGEGTDESTVAETGDGGLYLNLRTTRGKRCRAWARSMDGGHSWTPAVWDETLVDPSCYGNLIRFSNADPAGNDVLLLSHCADTRERRNLTVRVSYDDGQTWPASNSLHPGPSAYSCLAVLPDRTIGCLYEGGRDFKYEAVIFARFSPYWLTGGAD